MRRVKFEEFSSLADFFYHTVGIESYDKGHGKSSLTSQMAVIAFFSLINLSLILLAEITFVVRALRDGNNFVEAVTTLSYICFGFLGGVKLMCILWKRQALTELMKELLAMFPKTVAQQKPYRTREYLRKCKSISRVFSLLYMLLVWTYNLLPIARYLVLEVLLKTHRVGQQLPFILYIPWDWHGNWTYYLIYVLLCLGSWAATAALIPNDLLLSAVATQAIMHYDYLAQSIESYVPKGGQRNATAKDKAEDMEFISGIIKYHEQILRISGIINDVFGVPLFFNFATSSTIICFVGFQMTIGLSSDDMIKLGVFLVASLAQVYLICHFGQQLMEASGNIADAVYNQNWHNAEVRYKKMLILIAERAQNPAMLKATQFLKISRNTMTDIMQLSYKFFALLRTMYTN